jgi:sigma-B regulation protein RsbU (phosphoserine phosphatase)
LNPLQKLKLSRYLKYLGRVERLFCVLLLVYLPLALLVSDSIVVPILQFVLIILGAWILLHFTRFGMRKAIWRLRNRLLVTYLFIALVPVILIATLAGLSAYFLLSQLSVYLASSELQRRASSLEFIAQRLAESRTSERPEIAARIGEIYRSRFPGFHIAIATPQANFHWPAYDARFNPPEGWQTSSGIVEREGLFYAWSNLVQEDAQITVVAPLTRKYLSGMVPGLGDVLLFHEDSGVAGAPREPASIPFPPPVQKFDIEVNWFSLLPVAKWASPAKMGHVVLHVRTRPSAVLSAISSTNVDKLQGLLPILLLIIAISFFIVEIIALVIGVSLTRTITRAVHNLYRGTQRVIEGDFTHRIQVHGKDQLGELSSSFNTMTENLERLLVIAKEKERLQAEVEIAREVQEQLYPKALPELRTIRLHASCKPARMVSGDYYDYLCLSDGRLALAMGDVAGKGISAALLMATIQAAMRMELRSSLLPVGVATAPGGVARPHYRLPPGRLVSDLNQQLYATTAPEKYATFFFALYDENSGALSYTNAGHLQPLLIRKGNAVKLDVNGTVVGAFPFSRYEESTIQLESGDLLVCYTDGITEPENAYGEMYGEERLIELLSKNAERDEQSIVSMILEAVEQWTDAEEQPDDMTLLLARKV